MAAENSEQVAEANGHEIDVEVQGALGQENELPSDDIEARHSSPSPRVGFGG